MMKIRFVVILVIALAATGCGIIGGGGGGDEGAEPELAASINCDEDLDNPACDPCVAHPYTAECTGVSSSSTVTDDAASDSDDIDGNINNTPKAAALVIKDENGSSIASTGDGSKFEPKLGVEFVKTFKVSNGSGDFKWLMVYLPTGAMTSMSADTRSMTVRFTPKAFGDLKFQLIAIDNKTADDATLPENVKSKTARIRYTTAEAIQAEVSIISGITDTTTPAVLSKLVTVGYQGSLVLSIDQFPGTYKVESNKGDYYTISAPSCFPLPATPVSPTKRCSLKITPNTGKKGDYNENLPAATFTITSASGSSLKLSFAKGIRFNSLAIDTDIDENCIGCNFGPDLDGEGEEETLPPTRVWITLWTADLDDAETSNAIDVELCTDNTFAECRTTGLSGNYLQRNATTNGILFTSIPMEYVGKYFRITLKGDDGWMLRGIKLEHEEKGKRITDYWNPCVLQWLDDNKSLSFGPNDTAVCAIVRTADKDGAGTGADIQLELKGTDGDPGLANKDGLFYDNVLQLRMRSGSDLFEQNDLSAFGDFAFDCNPFEGACSEQQEEGIYPKLNRGNASDKVLIDTTKKGSNPPWMLGWYATFVFNPAEVVTYDVNLKEKLGDIWYTTDTVNDWLMDTGGIGESTDPVKSYTLADDDWDAADFEKIGDCMNANDDLDECNSLFGFKDLKDPVDD